MYTYVYIHLGVENVGVYWLVVVVLVSVFVEAEESVLEDLVDGGLASSRGTDTHEAVTNQLCLVQLNHLTNLSTQS